jgi:hypothetical protein
MGTSTIDTEREADADAVSVAFAQDNQPGTLDAWAVRRPEHARPLARLAADTFYSLAPDSGPLTPSSGGIKEAGRVREIGLSVLAARRPALNSLLLTLRAEGLDMDEAAAALQLPEGLLWKLHRRFVAWESVPAALLSQLSQTVRRSVEDVQAYLAQPPMLAAGASYRTDTSPEAHQESFENALTQDPETTDAMRDHWLPG